MSVSASPYVDLNEANATPAQAVDLSTHAHSSLRMSLIPEPAWDPLVAEFDGVCQEMTRIFAVNRWPKVKLEPVVFYLNDEPVAGALVMLQKIPLRLGHLAVIKWGPTLRFEQRDDAHEIYTQAIDMLAAEYGDRRKMMLSVMPRASKSEACPECEYLQQVGFKTGGALKFPNRYIVNVRQSDEELRKSFAQKWRYHFKKSEKAGLEFEHCAGGEKFSEFDELYQNMMDRKRFPDYSAYHTLEALMAGEVPVLRPEMFFVRKDGEAVGGALIFRGGKTAVYLYGATNAKALPLRAGYLMHWHVIRWLRDNTTADWYDLGGTDGFQGLHQFKKGMVGNAGVVTPVAPIMNYASSAKAQLVGNAAYAARDGLQHIRHFVNWVRHDMARPNQER